MEGMQGVLMLTMDGRVALPSGEEEAHRPQAGPLDIL